MNQNQVRTIISIFSFLTCFCFQAQTQVTGTILDEQNNPLAFANIYVEDSTNGVSSNEAGAFLLKVKEGTAIIVFQYVGYKMVKKQIDYTGVPIDLNVQLLPETYDLEKITITADAEDPAYAIIRNAQAKRKYNRDLTQTYQCDVFIKGNQKILDAPTKIMGQSVGDLEGALDSNRQGIVYLSETISEVYFDRGKTKEILKSSKVSGTDQGYSYNSAVEMEHNFYENVQDITRAIVSPIANNAMSFYKYKLIGARLDENGKLINQIKVTPKSENLPAYQGDLYIVEDSWNIHSLDLLLTKKNLGIPFLDTLNFKQIYIPNEQDDKWLLSSNIISFRAGFFGFDFNGIFAAVYSNYSFDSIEPSFFTDEIYLVEPESNTRSETYWDSIRPIPLTSEEQLDYHKKDSIRIVKESPAYLDSIDRDANRFGILSILTGYTHQNSINYRRFGFTSPISSLGYNTVQGLNSKIELNASVASNKFYDRRWQYQASLGYGLAEAKLRPQFSVKYNHDRINYLRMELSLGETLSQYNSQEPISSAQNIFETLFTRRNFWKVYNERFVSFKLSRFLTPKVYAGFNIKYADRQSVINHSDYSFFYKDDRAFTSNDPNQNATLINTPFQNQALLLNLSFNINLKRKIFRYPDHIFWNNAAYVPTIKIEFNSGLKIFESDADFGLAKIGADDTFSVGVRGNFSYYFGAGTFLWKSDDLSFIDYQHFKGNQIFDVTERGTDRFLSLPYFDFSTNKSFLQMNFEHDFNGYILDRIPLIKKLGWQFVASSRFLLINQDNHYQEFSVGLDNIGYKVLKIFQVHGIWSPQNEDKFRVALGIKNEF